MPEIKNSLVSIIITCYNYADFIADAIDSALNQTYKNIEIVIVNDASKDKSSEVIRKYADKYKNIIFFDNTENKGVVYSRNMAIEASRGKYILPLDADDIIDKTYVEKAVNILDTMPEIGIAYCKGRFFGKVNKKWKLPKYNKDEFLFENCIFATALFRKEDFLKVGKYKDCMKDSTEDWDLWISFIESGLKPYRIEETLFYYRIHSGVSRNSQLDQYCSKRTLIKNHFETYISSDKFIEKCFSKNKTKKYKKLFNIFLLISIFEFLLVLIFLWRLNA